MQTRYLDLSEIPKHPDVPVYGSARWLAAVAQTVPYPLRILGLEDEGRIVAWHPFHTVQRGPWTRALPLFVDTTGGPYYLPPENLPFAEKSRWLRDAQRTLLEALVQEVDFATLCPLESDPRALPTTGDWKITPRATARLDLTLENPPWSSQALRKLRKAGNKGLRLVLLESPARLSAAIQSVHERHGLGRSSLAAPVLASLRDALQSSSLLETWCVLDVQGTEVAYGVVALDPGTDSVRFWFNLNTPEGLKLYASDFLFHGIAQAYRGRFRWFDLCGTDNANLIEFKEKWASESRYAFAYDYARKPWMRLALAAFSKLRR